jgi:hypothetical protein
MALGKYVVALKTPDPELEVFEDCMCSLAIVSDGEMERFYVDYICNDQLGKMSSSKCPEGGRYVVATVYRHICKYSDTLRSESRCGV